MSECSWPTCSDPATHGIHCFQHYRVYGTTKNEKPKQNPIPVKSAKAKDQHKEYLKIVKEMMKESDQCEMRTPVCTGKAEGLQHKKRRGKNLLNKEFLIRSCNMCQDYVEKHPKWAIENDLAISKYK